MRMGVGHRIGKRSRWILLLLGLCCVVGAAGAIAQPQATGDLLPFLAPLLDTDEAANVAVEPLEGDSPIGPDDFKALKGYGGPLFNPDVQTGSVEVLESTLHPAPSTSWGVVGLARNQTRNTFAQVTIRVQLRSSSGELLDTASATSPVRGVRPGEPAPFVLTSEVPASSVADVRYSAAGAAGAALNRDLDVTTYWQLPYGDRPGGGGASFPHSDPPAPPYPYVRYGNVQNLSDSPLSPTVVGAWLDAQGHVLNVAVLPRITSDSAGNGEVVPDTGPIAPDSAGDYVYENDDPAVAPTLADAEFIRWATGTP